MNSDNITDIQVIFSLFNKIKKIKDNLKEYIGATLYDDKKSDKVKVIFSWRQFFTNFADSIFPLLTSLTR